MASLLLITDIIEKIVLTLLFGLSIWSITIIIDRQRLFKNHLSEVHFKFIQKMIFEHQLHFKNKTENHFFIEAFKSAEINSNSFQQIKSIDRSISSYIKEHRIHLEKGLPVLATLGANAPFIGLFGTVLGIIRSFAYLGTQSGSSAVMTGVSQALYATAVGLLVAIPAVVAFNFFSNQIKQAISRTESLRDLLISKLENE